MVPEDLAVITINHWHFLSLLIEFVYNEGLVYYLLAAEIRRQEMRDHEVYDILVADGEDL